MSEPQFEKETRTKGANALQYFRLMGRKKSWSNKQQSTFAKKPNNWPENSDKDLSGRIWASSFWAISVQKLTKDEHYSDLLAISVYWDSQIGTR